MLSGALRVSPDLNREGDKELPKAKQGRERLRLCLSANQKSHGAQDYPPAKGEGFQVNSEREEVDQRQSWKMNPTGRRAESYKWELPGKRRKKKSLTILSQLLLSPMPPPPPTTTPGRDGKRKGSLSLFYSWGN